MTYRIVVVDYSPDRLHHLKARLEEKFPDKTEVVALQTSRNGSNVDTKKLKELKEAAGKRFWGWGRPHRIDLLIGHIGGNPSGYDCLKSFKESNPAGKAILYTKMETLPLDQFRGLRLANEVVRRAEDERRVFKNDAEMLDVVDRVRGEQPIVLPTNPFKAPPVIAAMIGFGSSVVGLVAAVAKLLLG
ncbi:MULTISPECIES: hypothetical protein [unclassified Bradyrhizobium]|uniref:hypothetical protein n=1 Tax=unclassified Bradyrhizobium TaxID=2631580 RepID=UPI002FF010AE